MKKNRTMIIAFLTPAVFCYCLVFLYPTIRTVCMSFFKVEGVTDSILTWQFNGIENYKTIFSVPLFRQAMLNIAKIWLYGGIGVMLLAIIFAVILTSGIKGKRFFRSVIYLPNVVSAVAMGTMWIQYVYSPEYGLFNSIASFLFGTTEGLPQWTGPDMIFTAMLIAYCFGMVGYHMLIFMSGIERLPKDYFEAAMLEGANIFQQFFKITLPLLRGVIRTNIVLWTVTSVGFFVWTQIFSPLNPSSGTVTPMSYMYERVFGSSMSVTVRDTGAGSAIGVVLTVIIVIVFMLTNFIVRKDDVEI